MASRSEDILEGFICPICKKDLVTALLLSTHFQEEHNDDQDVLRSLKDLFGKAKKKILKQDVPDHEYFQNQSETECSQNQSKPGFYSRHQTVGCIRSHMETFRMLRSARVEHYAAETNKLLIRLDKLLIDMPTDPIKRKAHEQQVVPWLNDADVPLCPSCTRPFQLLMRRKHHCRLCGAIMCHECSKFFNIATARKLTNPMFGLQRPRSALPQTDVVEEASHLSSPSSSPALHSSSNLRRSGSNSSLGSALSAPLPGIGPSFHSEPTHLRLCEYCRGLLKRREELWESKPVIVMMYEQLRDQIRKGEQLITVFHTMCNSLNAGESTYNLLEAQMARVQLLKWAETIDQLSKNIALHGSMDEEVTQGRVLKLQQSIRSSVTIFLRQTIADLPTLPSESRLKELQENRRREMQLQILREKQLIEETRLREVTTFGGSSTRRGDNIISQEAGATSERVDGFSNNHCDIDTGWGPETQQQSLNIQDDDDPMVQQINIIRNYIRQAKEEHKYDEVATLENNLKELLEEFYKQLQEVKK